MSNNTINRFLKAQNHIYEDVLLELKSGEKRGHWMWVIFPQEAGLGKSDIAQFYAIKDKAEAIAYINHPVLGSRLIECSEALLSCKGKIANDILGFPDDVKLKSSMEFLVSISKNNSVFKSVLNKFFENEVVS